MDSHSPQHELHQQILELVFLAAYVGFTAWGCIALKSEPNQTAPIWLANGGVLGFLMYYERRKWWPYLLVGFLANLAADIVICETVVSSIWLSLLNSFEIIFAATCLYFFLGTAPILNKPGTILRFAFIASFFAPLVTSLLAGAYLWQIHVSNPMDAFGRWFLGDAIGLTVVTPLVLAFLKYNGSRRASKSIQPQG